MERTYKIAAAVQHYILGEATEREKREVEDWLAASERHRQLMEKFSSEAYFSGQLPEYEVFDMNRAYERFRKSKRSWERRRLFVRCCGVAAMVCILLSVFIHTKDKEPVVQDTVIMAGVLPPGCSKAILTLEGGEKVLLNDSLHFELVQQAARIEVSGQQINYKESEDCPDSIIPAINTVMTSRGGEYRLTLADGTKVWLNADSWLEFPVRFVGRQREVKVKGEVFFEVAKDSLHPFVVSTDKAKVRVLGTAFNVRAYPEEAYRTTLLEGSVEIVHRGETVKLKPNEQWILDGEIGQVAVVEPRVVSGWVNGSFAFENELLTVVFQELERWYDVEVFLVNAKIKELRFTGIFPRYGSMDKVLEIIELAAGVSCEVNDRAIVVNMNEDKPGK